MILPVKPSWRSVSAQTRAATPTRDAHLSPITHHYGARGEGGNSPPETRLAAHSIREEGMVQTTSLTSPKEQHCVRVERTPFACVLHPHAAFKILE